MAAGRSANVILMAGVGAAVTGAGEEIFTQNMAVSAQSPEAGGGRER